VRPRRTGADDIAAMSMKISRVFFRARNLPTSDIPWEGYRS